MNWAPKAETCQFLLYHGIYLLISNAGRIDSALQKSSNFCSITAIASGGRSYFRLNSSWMARKFAAVLLVQKKKRFLTCALCACLTTALLKLYIVYCSVSLACSEANWRICCSKKTNKSGRFENAALICFLLDFYSALILEKKLPSFKRFIRTTLKNLYCSVIFPKFLLYKMFMHGFTNKVLKICLSFV